MSVARRLALTMPSRMIAVSCLKDLGDRVIGR